MQPLAKITVGAGIALTGGLVSGSMLANGTKDDDLLGQVIGLGSFAVGSMLASRGAFAINDAMRAAGTLTSHAGKLHTVSLFAAPALGLAAWYGARKLMDDGRARPWATIDEEIALEKRQYESAVAQGATPLPVLDRSTIAQIDTYEGWGAKAGDGVLAWQDFMMLREYRRHLRDGAQ